MSAIQSTIEPTTERFARLGEARDASDSSQMPLVSLVVPAYNEAAIVQKNLATLCDYMESLEEEYRWEVIFINDGSTDATGELAAAFAKTRDNVHVFHHRKNFGVGQAFKLAFNFCRGDYLITLDLDLSYSPDHIRRLLNKIKETRAKTVVTSPYMKGGRINNVPWLRGLLSICANRFLSLTAKGNVSTLTSMVRAYDGRFLRGLDLTSMGMEINPEIIYKAMLLNARIEEIPAVLDWRIHKADRRRSSVKLMRHTMAVLLSGFLFRPVMFFLIPGFALLLFALYVNSWLFVHFYEEYVNFAHVSWFPSRCSQAVAAAYRAFPHTFIVGLLSLTLAIQLIGLGIMSLQNKRYFEEMFHLGSSIYRSIREGRPDRT